jgi:hypothetical protein
VGTGIDYNNQPGHQFLGTLSPNQSNFPAILSNRNLLRYPEGNNNQNDMSTLSSHFGPANIDIQGVSFGGHGGETTFSSP